MLSIWGLPPGGGLRFSVAGCMSHSERVRASPPPPEVIEQTQVIDYADSDAFDEILRAALVRQDHVIVVQTGTPQPTGTAA